MPTYPLTTEDTSMPCTNDPELWVGDHNTPNDTAKAKSMCVRCPVRAECLTLGLRPVPHHTNGRAALTDGIYGGYDLEERKALIANAKNPRAEFLVSA